ncbi:U-box domain-containing protein 33-like [Dorcoceras hygrometricum]|uniref:U-box domain-containing protein 33-like n=1 Tax=Dorcoceras hygrometricum TaxID=472368 RepID=A0A2Z7CZS0_9LAMI|nr:U-box domain-containing protein 33-like [Dorcoceras hygrometricum]
MLFTTDDIPLGDETVIDQILMPTAYVTPQDFSKPLAQLRASVNQIQIERVQKMDDVEKLKDVLLLHIRGLEQRFTEILEQQDRTYRGLFANVRQEFQLQKASLSLEILESRRKLQSQQVTLSQDMDDKLKGIQDQQAALSHDLMEFHVQAQENYNTLTSQLSELVDYINRGGDAKKREGSSSRGPQPPPDDRTRPGSGDSSRWYDKLKGIQDQQAALSHDLMEFHVQAQENYNTLTSQLSELVDYINRGGDAKKREGSSSRGPQPPPDDRTRPGSGDSSRGRGSMSEPARKRGGGGSHRRDWRYWIGGS